MCAPYAHPKIKIAYITISQNIPGAVLQTVFNKVEELEKNP